MGYLYRVILQYNDFLKFNKRGGENYCFMSNSGGQKVGISAVGRGSGGERRVE